MSDGDKLCEEKNEQGRGIGMLGVHVTVLNNLRRGLGIFKEHQNGQYCWSRDTKEATVHRQINHVGP